MTDLETYNLYFIEKYNSEDENENGLYLIWLSKDSEKDEYEGNYGAGIYFPSWINNHTCPATDFKKSFMQRILQEKLWYFNGGIRVALVCS